MSVQDDAQAVSVMNTDGTINEAALQADIWRFMTSAAMNEWKYEQRMRRRGGGKGIDAAYANDDERQVLIRHFGYLTDPQRIAERYAAFRETEHGERLPLQDIARFCAQSPVAVLGRVFSGMFLADTDEARAALIQEMHGLSPDILQRCIDIAKKHVLDRFVVEQNLISEDTRRNILETIIAMVEENVPLVHLGLSSCGINNSDYIQMLADALAKNTTIRHFDFSGNELDDAGAGHFARAFAVNHTLTDTSFKSNIIGDEGARAFAEAFKVNGRLKDVALASNPITGIGAAYLAEAYAVNPTLERAEFNACHFGPFGARKLAEALLGNSTVTHVSVADHRGENRPDEPDHPSGFVGAVGAVAFAKVLEHPSCAVESLDLRHSLIGEEGLIALGAALKVNRSLVDLLIDYNPLTEKGAEALIEGLAANTTLASFSTQGDGLSSFTDEQMQRLSDAMIASGNENIIRIESASPGIAVSAPELDAYCQQNRRAALQWMHRLAEEPALLSDEDRKRVHDRSNAIKFLMESVAAADEWVDFAEELMPLKPLLGVIRERFTFVMAQANESGRHPGEGTVATLSGKTETGLNSGIAITN